MRAFYNKPPGFWREVYELGRSRANNTNTTVFPAGAGAILSRYDRKNRIIQVGTHPVPREVVHEIAHALETKLALYCGQQFFKVLYRGTESVSLANVIRVEMEKLISEYQGGLYKDGASLQMT